MWLATGHTDMRKGFDGLASLVQDHLRRDPFSGQAFVFRGRQGGLVKVLWWDGQGFRLFAKRLTRGPLPAAGAERDDFEGKINRGGANGCALTCRGDRRSCTTARRRRRPQVGARQRGRMANASL